MQSRIPLPTDNIYKFYALLGLLILLTTAIMFFTRHIHYNSMAFDRYIPMEILKAKKTLNKDEARELLVFEERAKMDESDEDVELGIYAFFFLTLGVGFTVYGFGYWHTKIQPKQDRLLDLQIQKLEKEIKASNRPLGCIRR